MKILTILPVSIILNFSIAFGGDALNVVSSIQTLGAIASEIGGDKVVVTSLSKGYMDPHFVDAKPSLVLDLHKADLLIHVGLELEVGWLPPLVQQSRNANIQVGENGDFEAATVIHILRVPTVRVTRAMGDLHPQGNPHFWIPPKNALLIAKALTERFKKLKPDQGAYFDSQYSRFLIKVSELEKKLEPQMRKTKGLKVVPFHDSWAYVSEWLGLEETGYIEIKPGVPASPQHLSTLIGKMNEDKTKAILMENYYNKSTAESVASNTKAKLLEMPSDVGATPEIKTYSDLVTGVVTKIIEAVN